MVGWKQGAHIDLSQTNVVTQSTLLYIIIIIMNIKCNSYSWNQKNGLHYGIISVHEWSSRWRNWKCVLAVICLSGTEFNIFLLTYSVLSNQVPSYLKDLIVPHCSDRPLHSQTDSSLMVPRVSKSWMVDRAFILQPLLLWETDTPSTIKHVVCSGSPDPALSVSYVAIAIDCWGVPRNGW